MNVTPVSDLSMKRAAENFAASLLDMQGSIEYVACMADIELPEDESPEQEVPHGDEA